MKILLVATTVIAFSSAFNLSQTSLTNGLAQTGTTDGKIEVDVEDGKKRDRINNQSQCDMLESNSLLGSPNPFYNYIFNQDACACFLTWITDPVNCDPPTTVFNPLHEPGNVNDLCIPKEEYDAIFKHDYGPYCLPRTFCDCDFDEDPYCVPAGCDLEDANECVFQNICDLSQKDDGMNDFNPEPPC